MKQTLALYEHSTIGFPKIVLKFSIKNSSELCKDPYFTVHGVMTKWNWAAHLDNCFEYDLEKQIKRFDEFIRATYANNISVQG